MPAFFTSGLFFEYNVIRTYLHAEDEDLGVTIQMIFDDARGNSSVILNDGNKWPGCGYSLIINNIENRTGKAVPGVVLTLSDDSGVLQTQRADDRGAAIFCIAPCRSYTITVCQSPACLHPMPACFSVYADRCRRLYAGGRRICCRCIAIYYLRCCKSCSFCAVKVDKHSGAALQGATFELRQNGRPIVTAVSDEAGRLRFDGLVTGRYQLTEVLAPEGYNLNRKIYDIMIEDSCEVRFDGNIVNEVVISNSQDFRLIFKKVAVPSS